MERVKPQPAPVAAIDIGTNSVKCLVARVQNHRISDTLLDTIRTTRLGEGIAATGTIGQIPMARTVQAVAELTTVARGLGAERIRVTGTSAVREAPNASDLARGIFTLCGLTLEVLSGDDEARLAYLGAVGRTSSTAAIFDLGGGSTEWAVGDGDRIVWRHSFPAGAVRFTEMYLKSDPPDRAELAAAREAAKAVFAPAPRLGATPLIGVGGTVRAIVEVALDGKGEAEGFVLTSGEVDRQLGVYSGLSVVQRREIPGMAPDRADIILAGAVVLAAAVRQAGAAHLKCTLRGLRHGMVLKMGSAD